MLLDTFAQHIVDGAKEELENHDGLWIGSGVYEDNGDWGPGGRNQNGLVVVLRIAVPQVLRMAQESMKTMMA